MLDDKDFMVESRTLLDRLTPRELQMAELVSVGADNHEISELMGLSVRSVENVMNRLYRSLGLTGVYHRRLQVALIYLSGGFDPRAFRAALEYCQTLLSEQEASAKLEIAAREAERARLTMETMIKEMA